MIRALALDLVDFQPFYFGKFDKSLKKQNQLWLLVSLSYSQMMAVFETWRSSIAMLMILE